MKLLCTISNNEYIFKSGTTYDVKFEYDNGSLEIKSESSLKFLVKPIGNDEYTYHGMATFKKVKESSLKVGDKLRCVRIFDMTFHPSVIKYTQGESYEVVEEVSNGEYRINSDNEIEWFIDSDLVISTFNKPLVKFEKFKENEMFKVGQLVYKVDNKQGVVLAVVKATTANKYPIKVDEIMYTIDGKYNSERKIPILFPATPEWYEKLVGVYGEDNVEKLPPTPHDIMEKLLEDGCHTALVSDISLEKARKGDTVEMISEKVDGRWVSDSSGMTWKYVIPCDSRGNEITHV